VEAAPPQRPDSLTIEVSNQILLQLPKEHVEAVIDEAMQVWRSQEDRHGTLVVVNSRRMAVILDRQANRGAVLPVEMIYPRIDDSTRAGVQAWLEAPTARRLEFQIAGSWFMPQRVESRKSEVKEPAFLHTNMTYDAPPKG
jgi:hypothetical protein